MDEFSHSNVIELDQDRFIQLESTRRWPKYAVDWWVRRRAGESDFPVAHGTVERMPPAGEADAEEVWAEMRQEAETQAMEAAERLSGGAPEKPRRSLLDRLLGRRA